MIEGLLAFVVLIAAWRLQVWVLKRRLRRVVTEKTVVQEELNRVSETLAGTRHSLAKYQNYYGPTAFTEEFEKRFEKDAEWPELIN